MLNTSIGDDIAVETILNLLNAINQNEEARQKMKPVMVMAGNVSGSFRRLRRGAGLPPAQDERVSALGFASRRR